MFFWSMPKTTCKAVSGAVDLTDTKLSQQASRFHYACKVVSARLHWAASLQPFPQREKLGDQMVELWSQRKWVPSAWSCCSSATGDIFTRGTWDYVVISNQITFIWWRQIIKSFIAVDLVRTVMAMALKDLWFWGLSFWVLVDWCSLFVWAPKGITADILHAVKSADWIDCLL